MNPVACDPPDVSVCLLAWNHGHYIGQCIESVLAQAVDVRIEILIGDDASSDGTSEIIATYARSHPQLVRHIHRSERLGGSANYLDLLSRARARLIAHLDGDDFWFPGKLRQQVAYLREHTDCAAVYTNAVAISERGEQIGIFNDFRDTKIELSELLRNGNFLCNSSMLHRSELRAAIIAIQGPLLDYRIHLTHATRGYLAQLPERLVGYRVNSTGSMVAQANDFVRKLYWEAIQNVPRAMVSDDDYAHGLADFLRRVFFRAMRTGRWEIFREWRASVWAASPYGKVKTDMLTTAAILRIAAKELAGRFRRDSTGHRSRVLYRC